MRSGSIEPDIRTVPAEGDGTGSVPSSNERNECATETSLLSGGGLSGYHDLLGHPAVLQSEVF